MMGSSLYLTLIPTQNLRDALDSMYDAKVPEIWRKVCCVGRK
jgi:hypothetical protein